MEPFIYWHVRSSTLFCGSCLSSVYELMCVYVLQEDREEVLQEVRRVGWYVNCVDIDKKFVVSNGRSMKNTWLRVVMTINCSCGTFCIQPNSSNSTQVHLWLTLVHVSHVVEFKFVFDFCTFVLSLLCNYSYVVCLYYVVRCAFVCDDGAFASLRGSHGCSEGGRLVSSSGNLTYLQTFVHVYVCGETLWRYCLVMCVRTRRDRNMEHYYYHHYCYFWRVVIDCVC